MADWLKTCDDAVYLEILVVPRASRNAIVGIHEDRLKLQITAPPVDGAANKAITKLLTKALGIGKSACTITAGETGRRKTIRIDGVCEETVRALAP